MSCERRLVLSATAFEVRAALLEDGTASELFIERVGSRGIAGNLYQARVRKILPGMQCAFVDIGLDRDAFLYVADVAEPASGEEDDGELAADAVDGLDSASGPLRGRDGTSPPIESLLEEGQEVLVQVAKEPMAGKGARVTTHVTLPGRYLVYMPTIRHLGVSRRIESEAERQRLRAAADTLRTRTGEGFIVRTAAEGHGEDELRRDATVLRQSWEEVAARALKTRAPALVHAEMPLLDKLLRDVATGDLQEIIVDSPEDRERALVFLRRLEPDLADRVQLFAGPGALFEAYGIETEIERALRSKIWLKSGGYIVINQTEALVAIDVNTGRYVGKHTLEDTVLKTNLEAVREIVRQIRLRDLGGIIVLDLIDMESSENRTRVLAALESELKRDRSKTRILQISDFGLVEMTRKRVKGSLERTLLAPCRTCQGSGRVKSAETVCYELHRQILASRATLPEGTLVLRVHPEVRAALQGAQREVLADLERELSRRIELEGEALLGPDRFEIQVP